MGRGAADEPPGEPRRLTVKQAAERLGISEGAVRSRIKRGTLATTREGGHVYVLVGGRAGGEPADEPPADHRDQLIAALREQLEAEREARRRADHIIATLASRIPELEAPPTDETPSNRQNSPPNFDGEGSGGGEDAERGTEAHTEPQQHAEGAFRRFWRWLIGGGR